VIIIRNNRRGRGDLALGQLRDYFTQSQQGLVNTRALFKARLVRRVHRLVARPERGAVALRACQVHQVYLRRDQLQQGLVRLAIDGPGPQRRLLSVLEHLREAYLKDGMRPGRFVVHIRVGGGASFITNVQPHLGVLGAADSQCL